MKKLALRAYFALALAAVLAIGAFAFTISYFVKADDWVMFSGSPHVYSGANLSVGYVDDRDGTRLLDAMDGRTCLTTTDARGYHASARRPVRLHRCAAGNLPIK